MADGKTQRARAPAHLASTPRALGVFGTLLTPSSIAP
jgi:hypothetical protein